jgi:hypothetical protein
MPKNHPETTVFNVTQAQAPFGRTFDPLHSVVALHQMPGHPTRVLKTFSAGFGFFEGRPFRSTSGQVIPSPNSEAV